MAEEEIDVKVVKIDFKCPNCDDGYLRPTGTCLPMNPPLYPHKCNGKSGCGYSETFRGKTYPLIEHK